MKRKFQWPAGQVSASVEIEGKEARIVVSCEDQVVLRMRLEANGKAVTEALPHVHNITAGYLEGRLQSGTQLSMKLEVRRDSEIGWLQLLPGRDSRPELRGFVEEQTAPTEAASA